jgi:hypothetical protein
MRPTEIAIFIQLFKPANILRTMSPGRVSVIVIGASHAGLAFSHKLLRQVLNATLTLINPSDEYYFNIAAS